MKLIRIFGVVLLTGLVLALGLSLLDAAPVTSKTSAEYAIRNMQYVPPSSSSPQSAPHYVALDGTCGGQAPCYTSVQAAVDAAGPGDKIRVATGVYTGVQTRAGVMQIAYISKSLTLRGGYSLGFTATNPAHFPTVLDAEGQGRVFFITDTVTIENFILTGGSSTTGGGIYVTLRHGNHVTFATNVITGNTVTGGGGGGGIYIDGEGWHDGHVTLRANTFQSNTAQNGGGLTIGNMARSANCSPEDRDHVVVTGNTFRYNTAHNGGGALQIWESCMSFTDNTVMSNTAWTGGGLWLDSLSSGIAQANTIAYNTVGECGGGIRDEGWWTLKANQVLSNTAGYGGGICDVYLGTIYHANEIAYNHAGDAAGLYIADSKYSGGGYPTACSGDNALYGNLIHDNTATQHGGGLYLLECQHMNEFANNVIINNSADSAGSGVYFNGDNTYMYWTLKHTTIGNNGGGDGTGIYALNVRNFEVPVSATLFYSQAVGVKVNGSDDFALSNTFWDGSVLTETASVNTEIVLQTDSVRGDAALAPDGYHLTWASDAIDAVLISDIRNDVDGEPRPVGFAADSGADEYLYEADLALDKVRLGSGVVAPGAPVTYLLTISNALVSAWVPDVLLVDTFSPITAATVLDYEVGGGDECEIEAGRLTCTLHNVMPGSARQIPVRLLVTSGYTGMLQNTAVITPLDAVDPNPDDNAPPPVQVTVGNFPDLLLQFAEETAGKAMIPNEPFTYTLEWGNQGSIPAGGSWLDVTLPPSVTFEGASSPNYTWNETERTVSWDLGEVSAGHWEGDFNVYVLPAYDLPHGEEVTTQATIATTTPGDPPQNNQPSIVNAIFSLKLSTWAEQAGPLRVGETVRFHVKVENKSAHDVTATIVDTTRGTADYVAGSASASYGSVTANDTHGTWLRWSGTVPPSSTLHIQFQAKIESCADLLANHAVNEAGVLTPFGSSSHETNAHIAVICPNLRVEAAPTTPYLHFDPGLAAGAQARARFLIDYENQYLPGEYDASIDQVQISVMNLVGNERLAIVAASPGFSFTGPGKGYLSLSSLQPGESGQAWIDVAPVGLPSLAFQGHYALHIEIGSKSRLPGESYGMDNAVHTFVAGLSLAFEHNPAGNPLWHYTPDTGYRYQIPYLLRYVHYSGIQPPPSAEARVIEDTLPAGFAVVPETVVSSAGDPVRASLNGSGNLEIAFTRSQFPAGEFGWVRMKAVQGETPVSYGDQLVNRAELRFNLQGENLVEHARYTNTVGMAAPLISFPHTGELCPGEFRVKGIAMPGTEVSIVNANGGQELATATPDADWNFTSTPIDASLPLKLQAMSCTPDGENCSPWSRPVYLFSSTGGWCPQSSRWEGTVKYGPLAGTYQRYSFKNRNGNYSTQGWQIGGVYGFNDTDLTLVGCPCTQLDASRQMTVVADGLIYTPVSVSGNQFRFRIGGAHNVKIISSCGDDKDESPGVVLIDPDGFVFDAHEGGEYDTITGVFDPVRAIPGVTVTCMMSAPEQGGWIPWPAHVYSQTNPQVTDATYPDGITTTGYYAFFTPPGHYYIQVEGIPGYQAWRSPVVEVITEIVHVNVPYTPLPDEVVRSVTLTPDGPDPAVVTVTAGSAVEWRSELRATDTISDLISWVANPVLHLKSDLDVLLDTGGWDAGYLEPGRTYRRRFTSAGTYAYTDALGHVGTVVVEPTSLYLPLVTRQ